MLRINISNPVPCFEKRPRMKDEILHLDGNECKQIPRLLFKYLLWTGIIQYPNQKIRYIFSSHILDILVLAACLEIFFTIFVFSDTNHDKSTLAFLFSYIFTAAAWYMMRYKRKRVTRLLYDIKETNLTLQRKKINTLVAINCVLPMIIPAIMIYTMGDPEILRYYIYGYNFNESKITITFMYMKICFLYMVHPSVNNIMCLLYTCLCWGCSVRINKLTNKMEQYSPEAFGLSEQLDILKRKKKINDALHKIQNAFSEQIFFTILANVFMCGCVTGSLLIKNFEELHFMMKLDDMYYLINSVSCVALTLWIVGCIPIEMKKFHHMLFQRTQQRLLRCDSSAKELHLKIDFLKEPDFVMIGYDILPLSRSTILPLIGTLFTYTVLFMAKSMPLRKLKSNDFF
ncbi:uncharacterized protein NPIL_10301 [Nephila pilipes]|uniref:Uncharacterized protein n=1 Tax=Nephila pilipes TaxID=299642 RepID=A0A8X6TIE8_NEPPI|nr:uncharacterized protein NPIL_10301 [Nephila pilipes]